MFTSVRAGENGIAFPSYETILHDLDQHPDLNKVLQNISHAEINQIAEIAQHKQAGINIRLQTLALVSGVVALLSLAALVVAEDAIATAVNSAGSLISGLLGAPNPDIIVPPGFVLVLTALGLFVIGILRYAFLIYRELRLLEIINVVCALRLAAPASPPAYAFPPCPMSLTQILYQREG